MTVSGFQVFEPVLCLVLVILGCLVSYNGSLSILSSPSCLHVSPCVVRLLSLRVPCSPSLLYLSLCLSHVPVFCLPYRFPCSSLCVSSSSPQSVVCSHVCLFPYQCQVLFILIILSLSHYIQVSSLTSLCLIYSRCVSQWSPPLYSSPCVYVIPAFPCPSSESLLINSCVSQFFQFRLFIAFQFILYLYVQIK